ncbi:unnamed protein product, partial [Rotaria magnacalcarata]
MQFQVDAYIQFRYGVLDCFKLFQLWKSREASALTLCCRPR